MAACGVGHVSSDDQVSRCIEGSIAHVLALREEFVEQEFSRRTQLRYEVVVSSGVDRGWIAAPTHDLGCPDFHAVWVILRNYANRDRGEIRDSEGTY